MGKKYERHYVITEIFLMGKYKSFIRKQKRGEVRKSHCITGQLRNLLQYLLYL